jgi:D-xylose transport system substrate-binding protein
MVKFARALLAGLAVSVAVCGQAGAADKKIGVSWWNAQDGREADAMKAAVAAAGDTLVSIDARSAEQQLADLRQLIGQDVSALIVMPGDAEILAPAIDEAAAKNIPVISYGRPIERAGVVHVAFDDEAIGRMQAAAILKLKPEGNYAFIRGAAESPDAERIFEGQMEALAAALQSGAIRSISEIRTEGTQPASAKRSMEQVLTANDNTVDAVLTTDDRIADGVVMALARQGLEGPVAVAGQGGTPAALNRIALGTQAVTVFADARQLGRAAGRIATELAAGETVAALAGVADFATPGGTTVKAVLLPPTAVTRDNLTAAIDAGFASAAEVCDGVAPGAVEACP